ncbi:MAG: T9SS type A sorting domain-containing protein [Fibrobacter sp.]|mgnify:CR=1 FL=1|jgi:hypothetical protein|nr:T9SS type A sorting domain-containing protein [Fibrobacter sp.]
MAYLNYTIANRSMIQVQPSMTIITDPNANLETFDYAKAVATELQWLTSHNIITGVTDTTISRIEAAIDKQMGQFWTLQDTLLSYNAYYPLTIDTIGDWFWLGAIVERNECTESVQFVLPVDSLRNEITSVKKRPVNSVERNFAVRITGNRLSIDFYRNLLSPAHIEIIDLNGRLLHRITVPVNQNRFVMQSPFKPGRGIYQMIVSTKEFRETRALIINE